MGRTNWLGPCRFKLKKVGKTTGPLRYDLNQIPYNYTVEVTNRFRGLILIDSVPEELWMEVHDIIQEAVIKTIPKKKKCKMAKWSQRPPQTWGDLTNSWEKMRSETKGEKERHIHLNTEFQRIARREKKAFLTDQCKETEENNGMGKTRDLIKKITDTKGYFMQRRVQ